MGGIGGVATENATRHDCINRRWPLLHYANLHRRRVRAQNDTARLVAFDEEGVPHASCGVRLRHVERLEVVEVALDFRALGNLESETDEHVFETLGRLSYQVGSTTTSGCKAFGEIDPLRTKLCRKFKVFALGTLRGDCRLDCHHCGIQFLT